MVIHQKVEMLRLKSNLSSLKSQNHEIKSEIYKIKSWIFKIKVNNGIDIKTVCDNNSKL